MAVDAIVVPVHVFGLTAEGRRLPQLLDDPFHRTAFCHGAQTFERTIHSSLNELVNLGFGAFFCLIRRLHSASWLSAASNLAPNSTLGQIMAQISILAYPGSCLIQNTVIVMHEIIF